MKTTRGAIRLDKLFIYPISFCFKNNGDYYYDKTSSLSKTLLVRNEYGFREKLEIVEAHVGIDTLGIALILDGNMSNKSKLLQKKIGQ